MSRHKKDVAVPVVVPVVVPNPGSDEALDLGCRCPVLDNSHGYGYFGKKDVFAINASCPLHGKKQNDATISDK